MKNEKQYQIRVLIENGATKKTEWHYIGYNCIYEAFNDAHLAGYAELLHEGEWKVIVSPNDAERKTELEQLIEGVA